VVVVDFPATHERHAAQQHVKFAVWTLQDFDAVKDRYACLNMHELYA
jgi:hypothetical protein